MERKELGSRVTKYVRVTRTLCVPTYTPASGRGVHKVWSLPDLQFCSATPRAGATLGADKAKGLRWT